MSSVMINHSKLLGILNGIDYKYYAPEGDAAIAVNFTANELDKKYENKLALQREQFAWQKAQAAKSSSGGGSSGGRVKGGKKGSGSSSSGGSSAVDKGKGSGSSGGGSLSVDMSSVLALGYGPISASRLNQLVKEGKVVETEKNGKLVYKKVFKP